jgi:hypothetical protein
MSDYDAPDTAAAVYADLGVWAGARHELRTAEVRDV